MDGQPAASGCNDFRLYAADCGLIALHLVQIYRFRLMHSPKIAVVILNWNGNAFLEQFLPSVISSKYSNYELIIADNASTDDSISFLNQHYPQARVIRLAANYGFAKGYNEALKEVTADYYVLLNSDVEVTSDWLE